MRDGLNLPGTVLTDAEVEEFYDQLWDAPSMSSGSVSTVVSGPMPRRGGCCGRVGSRVQKAGAVCFSNHLAHASFDDRGAARVHHFNLGAAHIDANDFVAHGGEAGGRYGTDISQPKNANGQTQANSPGNRVFGDCCVALELYQPLDE